MMDKLRAAREPVAVIVELALAANLVAGIINVVLGSRTAGWLESMRAVGGGFMGISSLLVLMLAVAACSLIAPVTAHSRHIAVAGFLLAAVGALLALVFLVAGLFASQPGALGAALEAIGGLTDLTIKALAAFCLLYLARISPNMQPPRLEKTSPPTEPGEEKRTMPTWGRDQAVGARWNTAAEAARGARPTSAADEVTAPNSVAVPELKPRPSSQVSGVQPVAPDALDGPPAQADPGLWKRP